MNKQLLFCFNLLVHVCFLGRLFDRVNLINPVSLSIRTWVRMYVRAYVRPSIHKKFLAYQWSTSDAWRYAVWPIQGQGHEPFKVIFISSAIYNGSWQL